ncbi:MAG: ATP-dependent metallopeptidase FtsH/Yme1/Tma family protein, partial [Actinomycetota bacterium]|nr:ATP-dependent metallopeptidase FtsH/Yme1/Tma family protein [Actinomycetota bacterium]
MSNLPPPPPPPPPGRGRGQQRPNDQRPNPPGEGGGGLRRPGNWPRWTMWVLLGVLALALMLPSFWPDESGEKVTYTDFMQRVTDGEVASVVINNSTGSIAGTLEDGTEFTTTGGGERALSEADEATLRENGVEYEFRTPSNNWLLSIAG